MSPASRCNGDGEGQDPENGDDNSQPGDDVKFGPVEKTAIEKDDAEFEKTQGCGMEKVKGRLKL